MKDTNDDYENLILGLEHFKRGTYSKGNGIVYTDLECIPYEQFVHILYNTLKKHPIWLIEEHNIKTDILYDFQENTSFSKDPFDKQVASLVNLIEKIDHERVHRIGPLTII